MLASVGSGTPGNPTRVRHREPRPLCVRLLRKGPNGKPGRSLSSSRRPLSHCSKEWHWLANRVGVLLTYLCAFGAAPWTPRDRSVTPRAIFFLFCASRNRRLLENRQMIRIWGNSGGCHAGLLTGERMRDEVETREGLSSRLEQFLRHCLSEAGWHFTMPSRRRAKRHLA